MNTACVAFYFHNKCHLIFQDGPTGSDVLSLNGSLFIKGMSSQNFVSCFSFGLFFEQKVFFTIDPVPVPEPVYHEDFEDLGNMELHNNPNQVQGKVCLIS